jgi:cobalt-precorrin 5A hydrolase/precorrin-3B C17-methyltransferase
MTRQGVWGLGYSTSAGGLLAQLTAAGVVQGQVEATDLAERWADAQGFVVVGACGLVVRQIAPLLQGKQEDPAVVVVDPLGRFAIPLLGAHAAGAEALSQKVAAVLAGQVVSTGSSSGQGQLALDSFGRAWGWRRSAEGDWTALMQRAARRHQPLRVLQTSGSQHWQALDAARSLDLKSLQPPDRQDAGHTSEADLQITHQQGPGCRWHPPCLWLGIGCERNTSFSLLQRFVHGQLQRLGLAPEAVAGIASIDRKADEPALLKLAKEQQWPLRWFTTEQLSAVPVPNPSAVVAREMGTASVAEAAALLAGGAGASLLAPKQVLVAEPPERGAATLAIALAASQWAPSRGALHLVGSGPGRLDLLTGDARTTLAAANVWVGYSLYLDLLEPLRRPDQLRCDGRLTEERARCVLALELANQGLNVALVSSGDSGIYAMAGLALDLWLHQAAESRPEFGVHPGISAVQLAAARAGAPLMHDFCTISLSDRLTPWPVIERRLEAAAAGDFVVALYNPRSQGRDWQLGRAQELLLATRPAATPVVLARQLGRSDEQVSLHTLADLPVEKVDMLTLVLVGNSTSWKQDNWMVTPRGYPGSELS